MNREKQALVSICCTIWSETSTLIKGPTGAIGPRVLQARVVSKRATGKGSAVYWSGYEPNCSNRGITKISVIKGATFRVGSIASLTV